MTRTSRLVSHLAKKTSPKSWLGDLMPLDPDEAIIFGPVFRQNAKEYGDSVLSSFEGKVKSGKIEILLRHGHCTYVILKIRHEFFKNLLVFTFTPMRARDITRIIWTSITRAMALPNVDPVALARESLAHGTYQETSPQEQ